MSRNFEIIITILFTTFIPGTGTGLIYVTSVAAVPQYFHKHKFLAMAFVNSGMAIGQVIAPFIIEQLTDVFGWRGGITIITGLFLHNIVFSALLMPGKSQNITRSSKFNEVETRVRNNISCLKKIHCFSCVSNHPLMRNTHFLLFLIFNICFSFGQSIAYVHMGSYASLQGLSHNQVAFLFFLLGVIGIVARIVAGLIAQRNSSVIVKMFLMAAGCFGISIIGFSLSKSFMMLSVSSTFIAIFLGFFGALGPITTLHISGEKHLATAFGYVCLASAVGYLTGGPFAG